MTCPNHCLDPKTGKPFEPPSLGASAEGPEIYFCRACNNWLRETDGRLVVRPVERGPEEKKPRKIKKRRGSRSE